MLRIAYVANSLIPSRQANTAHVLNMSAALGETGADVTLVARGEPSMSDHVYDDFGVARSFGMRLKPLRPPKALDRLRFIRHVRKFVRLERIEFAYGRSWYGLLAGLPGSVPFAFDVHDFPKSRWRRWLLALLFRRSNLLFVTPISNALAERYASAFPYLSGRIMVLPCAAKSPDPSMLQADSREPGPLRIYYVGHLYPGRGLDLVLAIGEQEPDIEFHIVGGEDRDVTRWRARAPANVRFHGYVKPAQLSAHYRRADICLAPYGKDVAVAGGGDTSAGMSPMKIFEYMAHAKTIIASDLSVLRELIDPGVDGILCSPGDVEAWRKAIHRLRDDPKEIERLGDAGRRKFENEYSWEIRARRILQRASELIAGRTT